MAEDKKKSGGRWGWWLLGIAAGIAGGGIAGYGMATDWSFKKPENTTGQTTNTNTTTTVTTTPPKQEPTKGG